MNKETWFSTIRALLTLGGSYLIGKNVLGVAADSSTVEIIVGAAVSVLSVVWGIVDKTVGIEKVQTVIRQLITSVGGFLVAAGKLDSSKIELYIAAILPLTSVLASIFSRKKSDALNAGKISVQDLKTSS